MAKAKKEEIAVMQEKEAVYSCGEFAAQSYKLFGAAPEIVTVAFKLAAKTEATVEEAKKIVTDFLNKPLEN